MSSLSVISGPDPQENQNRAFAVALDAARKGKRVYYLISSFSIDPELLFKAPKAVQDRVILGSLERRSVAAIARKAREVRCDLLVLDNGPTELGPKLCSSSLANTSILIVQTVVEFGATC